MEEGRINLRVSPETKEQLQKLAEEKGISLTAFLVQKALQVDKPTEKAAPKPKTTDSKVFRCLYSRSQNLIIPANLTESDSFWTPATMKYTWSGRMDDAEKRNMALHLGTDEEDLTVTTWHDALNACIHAEITGDNCFSFNFIGLCAKFLYIVRSEKIPIDEQDRLMKSMNCTEFIFMNIRSVLRYSLTEYKDYLTGQYPWVNM